MAESQPNNLKKKEGRGIFLTVLLVIHSFISLLFFTLFSFAILTSGNIINVINSFFHGQIVTLTISLSIIILVIITAPLIWFKKKIGIYGLILLFIVWIIEYYLYELPNAFATAHRTNTLLIFPLVQSLWQFLLFSSLYFWAIKRKWRLFT